MAQGWIKIHRQMKDCWIYDDKPYDRTHAWIDLLIRANHQDKKIALGSELIEVKRGSFITSEVKLMDAWGWSKTKLRSFLKLLQDDGMIEIIADKKKTTVNIVNYSVYQESENQEKTEEEPQEDHKKTAKEPKKDTNKNDKELKNEKKIKYADLVYMTEEEYLKLIQDYGEIITRNKITDLSLWKGSKGKKTKSDYLTVLAWIRREGIQPVKNVVEQQKKPREIKIVEG